MLSKNKILLLIAFLLLVVFTIACSQKSTNTSSQEGETTETPAETDNAKEEEATAEGESNSYDISVIVKATDSAFWQTVLMGAEAAGEDLGVKITTDGPPSEADMQEQVSILENTITRSPDGILIASTSSDATVPAIEQAMNQDIPVVTIDNKVNTDNFLSFLATDNKAAGGIGADVFVKKLEEAGKELKGKVGVIGSQAGVEVVTSRIDGFLERLAEIAPDIEPIETKYVDNDIIKALGFSEDIILSEPDLLGFFGQNNHTSVGIARAVTEQNLQDDLVVVGFDSDEEEIAALEEGAIDSLIVQNPFNMGYQGVQFLVDHLNGKEVEKLVDTGATAVTMDNFNEDEIQKLLYPEKR